MQISRAILAVLLCATLMLSAHHHGQTTVTAAVTCDKYGAPSVSFCGDIFDKWNYKVSSQVDQSKKVETAIEDYNRHNITDSTPETCKTAIRSMLCSFAIPYCQGNYYQIMPCQSICNAARDECDASVLFYPVESIKSYCQQYSAMPCFDGTKVVTNSGVKSTTTLAKSGVAALLLISMLISMFMF